MNYILYLKASGKIEQLFSEDAEITTDRIADARSGLKPNWTNVALGKGTVPDGAENISEVADFEAVEVADELANRAFEVKSLKTLAILCNKRFTGATSGAITKAEFITEYKTIQS